jgi:hypothetical protein
MKTFRNPRRGPSLAQGHNEERNMNRIAILAVVACALTTACTVRSERTVVEKPVPASTASVVVADPAPGTTTERVVVRERD